jgi:hypothetical protein
MAAYRTVLVKGGGMTQEAVANAAITPGALLNFRSDGKVEENTDATKQRPIAVAFENEMFGKGIDDDYASGESIVYRWLHEGSEWNALVPAGAAAIALHDYVIPGAGGGVITGAGTSIAAVGLALEAVNNSAGSSEARILVRVIK